MTSGSATWEEGDAAGTNENPQNVGLSGGSSAYLKRIDDDVFEEEVKLWLITFTDVIALMLTFFVLLYSMSVPEEDKWEEISSALSSQFTKKYARPYRPGPLDTEITIEKISLDRALSLPYLKSLIEQAFKEREITNYAITQLTDRLVVALPGSALVGGEQAQLAPEADEKRQEQIAKNRAAMVILSDTINNIKNRVEIIGHGQTWTDSLDNAVKTAALLRQSGYDKEITVRAAEPLPNGKAEQSLDIVITRDNGLERQLLTIE